MTRTIVGVFDHAEKANAALNDLTTAGIRREQITLSDAARTGDSAAQDQDDGMLAGVRSFFGNLFGDDDRDAAHYSQAMRLGWTVVKVEADDAQAEAAVQALERSGAVDLEEKASEWRATGWSDPAAQGQSIDQDADAVLPVVQETLEVGKREVATGGVRVYSRLVETPVSESVELRSEHAEVHRRPVDRPVTAEDLDSLGDRTIVVRETAEKAVVSKTARVVEEVSVGKTVEHHTQQINETLRSTEVEVERLPATAPTATADSLYHDHFKTTFAATGGTYEEYAPAYAYGAGLRGDTRFAGRDWSTIEPEVRSDWEQRHPGSAWERFKDAVQHAWHKATH
ncbi:YsnF/AvaK domain-containing protein [Aquincola tertiaricarbonis]|uniref:YsnF/AvaK domain-containing protein n=1 Tax=Aquincola tertiaricarbonis TaxID=391953 RepID=A0ABY4S9I0_AQUTE|nr:YsnF/AvaK domain-containing protein [Aquincola tertiaricarbonis]URI07889.1 YsnF/AvaK domain-containing protein [Aquincola tertiaricarbonis]